MNLLSKLIPKKFLDRRSLSLCEAAASAISRKELIERLEELGEDTLVTANRVFWARTWLLATQRLLLIPLVGRKALVQQMARLGIEGAWLKPLQSMLEWDAPLMALVEQMLRYAEAPNLSSSSSEKKGGSDE